jgi:hypothetical protein
VGKAKIKKRRFLAGILLLAAGAIMTFGARATALHFNQASTAVKPQDVTWRYDVSTNKWLPNGTPPVCAANPLAQSPVDTKKITSVAYPGQYRNGAYNPNGAFSFDDFGSNEVKIYLPLDAKLSRITSYIENGDQQYSLFFVSPCGYAVKFDHLLILTSKYQKIVERLRPSGSVGSPSVPVVPPVNAKAGDQLASAVGLPSERSISFDFGLYDLRAPNKISQSTTWTYYHTVFKSTEWFGVCWFNLLPKTDAAHIKTLLQDGSQATARSDYCEAPGGITI